MAMIYLMRNFSHSPKGTSGLIGREERAQRATVDFQAAYLMIGIVLNLTSFDSQPCSDLTSLISTSSIANFFII